MEKNKLTTYTTPAGTAYYPYLFTPDTKFDANGVYRDWETDRKSTRLNSSH